MKEVNKHILQEALANLPDYQPNDSVWKAINVELTMERKEIGFKKSISELPEYDPPAMVWESIQSELDAEEHSKTKVFPIRRWLAAAVVLLVVSAGAWMLQNYTASKDNVSLSYSEETINASLLDIDWEEDEDAFAMVAEFCKTEQLICKQPDFKIMTNELEELNAAREELKAAMDTYGKDPELIAQLTVIEHERTDILKQIIKRI